MRVLLSNCDPWTWQPQADGKERTLVSPFEGCLSWRTPLFVGRSIGTHMLLCLYSLEADVLTYYIEGGRCPLLQQELEKL